jgi:hypothetical protein
MIEAKELPATEYISWANPAGVCSAVDANDPVEILIPALCSTNQPFTNPIYQPSELVINHPDFTRYITLDFVQLKQKLEQTIQYIHSTPFYVIECPKQDDTHFPIEFWFWTEHAPLILLKSATYLASRGLSMDRDVTYKSLQFNTVYLNNVSVNAVNNKDYLWTPKEVMDIMIERRRFHFDKNKLLMNLNDIRLKIQPLRGQQGWRDYEELAKSYRDKRVPANGADDRDKVARFTITISLIVEPYIFASTAVDSGITKPQQQQQQLPLSSEQFKQLAQYAYSHMLPSFDTSTVANSSPAVASAAMAGNNNNGLPSWFGPEHERLFGNLSSSTAGPRYPYGR